MKTHSLLLCALALVALAVSCSSGPQPPKPGTPAFFWGAAQQVYKSGDLLKTNDNLSEILQSENDFTAKARIWQIALSAGIVQGAEDLATAYEAGARMNRANPGPFRKNMTLVRNQAGRSALDLAQQVHILLTKEKGSQIVLEFPFPPGSAVEPAAVRKVYAGVLMPDAEAESLQRTMLQRGVVQTVCKLVGHPDDPAKSLELFKTTPVQVNRETFLFSVAKILFDESDIFNPRKLDQPARLKVMCDEATEALSLVADSKEKKALSDKIQSAVKKLKAT